MSDKQTNWLDEMIERQALPEEVREGTTEDFCKKWSISESTYYYQASKEENQKKIVSLALRNAKKYAPDVLENLGVRAKNNKADAELYLKFILQLAEKTDLNINITGCNITTF
uniref:Uncharacterized protein n=1 Tax=viral metagenome TaxID=1070528 RepID=A0A6H1ZQ53_9ZZZZ